MSRKQVRSPFLRLDVVSNEQLSPAGKGERGKANGERARAQLQPLRSNLIKNPFKQYQDVESEPDSTTTRRNVRNSTPNSFVVLQEATNAERRKAAESGEDFYPGSLLESTVSSLNHLHKTLRVKALNKNDDSARNRQVALMDRLIITPRAIVTTGYADLDYLHVDVRVNKQRGGDPNRRMMDPSGLPAIRREGGDQRLGNIRSQVRKQGRLLPYRPVVLSGPQIDECCGIIPQSELAAFAKSRTLNRRLAQLERLHSYENGSKPLRDDDGPDGWRATPSLTPSRTMRILQHVRSSMRTTNPHAPRSPINARPRSTARSENYDDSIQYYYGAQQSRSTTARSSSKASIDECDEEEETRSNPRGVHPPAPTRLRSAGSGSSVSLATYTVHMDPSKNANGLLVRPSSHRTSVVSTPCSLSFRASAAGSTEVNGEPRRSALSNNGSRVSSADAHKRIGSATSARRSVPPLDTPHEHNEDENADDVDLHRSLVRFAEP